MSGDIQIITEPTVRLISHQVIDEAELSAYLADEDAETWTTDTEVGAEKLIEAAGRICYASFTKPRPGGNAAYIDHILEGGHGSVLEHAVFSFIVTGISRSLTHEWVRHRAGWAYSQRSQRYCDEAKAAFVVPPDLVEEVNAAFEFFKKYQELHNFDDYSDAYNRCWISESLPHGDSIIAGLRWLRKIEADIDDYEYFTKRCLNKLAEQAWLKVGGVPRQESGGRERFLASRTQEDKTRDRKQAREAARSVLPNATETQITVTANARALRHFIEMRASEHAEAEIRRVALAMLAILQRVAPAIFGDYGVVDAPGVGPVARTKYRKV